MDGSFSHDLNWYCGNFGRAWVSVLMNPGSNNAHVNGHSNNGSHALPMKLESNSAPSSAGHSVDMQLHDPFSFQEVNIVPYGIGSEDTIDGIPRLSRVLSHKSKSTKSKQAAIAKFYFLKQCRDTIGCTILSCRARINARAPYQIPEVAGSKSIEGNSWLGLAAQRT
uniref:Uncharacterized protein n=1 Tax=Cannabis sativa TaxID=3483 RepID=A0A803Q1T0_CANSA